MPPNVQAFKDIHENRATLVVSSLRTNFVGFKRQLVIDGHFSEDNEKKEIFNQIKKKLETRTHIEECFFIR